MKTAHFVSSELFKRLQERRCQVWSINGGSRLHPLARPLQHPNKHKSRSGWVRAGGASPTAADSTRPLQEITLNERRLKIQSYKPRKRSFPFVRLCRFIIDGWKRGSGYSRDARALLISDEEIFFFYYFWRNCAWTPSVSDQPGAERATDEHR